MLPPQLLPLCSQLGPFLARSLAIYAEVTPKTTKALRDATGAGMTDCKTVLLEVNGDMEAATSPSIRREFEKVKSGKYAEEGKTRNVREVR